MKLQAETRSKTCFEVQSSWWDEMIATAPLEGNRDESDTKCGICL